MKQPYNGHESWNAWNVALWIGNDEPLYRAALDCMLRYPKGEKHRTNFRRAACQLIAECSLTNTPDGARYSIRSVTLALDGLEG